MSGEPPTALCVSALNEERTIGAVLAEAARCPLIRFASIVVNGSADGTAEAARRAASAAGLRGVVREVAAPLGHDVGRSLAAVEALERGADCLVFLDADFPVAAADLAPFARAAHRGVDVALNAVTSLLGSWGEQAPTAAARAALNAFLGRSDLGLDSLCLVPHALTRRAVETIGAPALAVPPLAQALAVMAGLEVRSVHPVNVMTPNRAAANRPRPRSTREMADLILGDHLEAIAAVLARRGPRGGLGDLGRRRDLAGTPPPGSHMAGGWGKE